MPKILLDVTPQDAARVEEAMQRGDAVRISTGATDQLSWPTVAEAERMVARLETQKASWPVKLRAAEELIWGCCKGAAASFKGRESVIREYAEIASRAARAYGNARIEQVGNWEQAPAYDVLGALAAVAGARVSRAALAEASHAALLRGRTGSGPEQPDLRTAIDVTAATRVGQTGLFRVRIVADDRPSALIVPTDDMVALGTSLRRGNDPDRAILLWLQSQMRQTSPARVSNPSPAGARMYGTPLSVTTTRNNGLVQTAYAYDRVTVVESRPESGGPVQVDEYF